MLDKEPTRFDCSITTAGIVRVPPRLREYYLTPEVGDGSCLVQAVGDAVRVWLTSTRDDIRLTLQADTFVAERPYERSLNRWGVDVSRYREALATAEGTVAATVALAEVTPDV